MPVRTQQTTTATATSMPWIPLSVHEDYSPVSFHITGGGTGDRTAQLQWTLDNVLAGVSAVPVTAFEVTGSAVTIATAGSISDRPMAAVRLRSATGSGAATLSLRILQGGV